ncbi:hypothetical protein [Rickettsia endosymbiont of Gonocerus acuteangulatus]|uniref:hypothetical protein n=1 Tax=Rickettsia endosymbiont of Gonocerus acuteangulatus TaxID=3066266 RepID=UPI0031331815
MLIPPYYAASGGEYTQKRLKNNLYFLLLIENIVDILEKLARIICKDSSNAILGYRSP